MTRSFTSFSMAVLLMAVFSTQAFAKTDANKTDANKTARKPASPELLNPNCQNLVQIMVAGAYGAGPSDITAQNLAQINFSNEKLVKKTPAGDASMDEILTVTGSQAGVPGSLSFTLEQTMGSCILKGLSINNS